MGTVQSSQSYETGGDVDRVPNQKLDLRFKLLVQACAFNNATAELRHMHCLNKAKDCSKL